MPNRPRPVVLCILDGWGQREDPTDNAIAAARTPVWDRLMATCPHALLQASGLHVGLPDDQFGNSEVGHLNIGAGRVVMQDLPRVDAAIADGSLARAPALVGLIEALRASGGTCHLLGLLSPGGVHAHQTHIAALARILDAAGIDVAVHAFLDGRDTPPSSARDDLRRFLEATAGLRRVRIATVGGRYYAMDRDQRWERVEKAYAALAEGQGGGAADPLAAVEASYAAKVTDEFVLPVVLPGYGGMRDGDGLLMANFRADRAREILSALLEPAFAGFARPRRVRFAAAVGITEYSSALNAHLATIFPAQSLPHVLGEIVAQAGLRQLRIAETEKYAHVTFFLNGGEETQYPGEERILVPSPKVATYDLQPEMSAPEVTDKLVAAVESGTFDLIVVNYANTDMVGHTGFLDAARRAVEAVDGCLGRLWAAVERVGGALVVTADHGNAELMRDAASGEPHTAHTFSPVPVILAGAAAEGARLTDGRLADVAPTVLSLLGLPQPAAMTGHSLIRLVPAGQRRAAAGD